MMADKKESRSIFFQEPENDSVMKVYSKRPYLVVLGVKFFNFQRGVKRIFFEEVRFFYSFTLNLRTQFLKKQIKGVGGNNIHLLSMISSRDFLWENLPSERSFSDFLKV